MKHKRHQKDKRDRDDRVGRYHSEINSNTVYKMKDISHDGNDDPTHPKKLIIYIVIQLFHSLLTLTVQKKKFTF